MATDSLERLGVPAMRPCLGQRLAHQSGWNAKDPELGPVKFPLLGRRLCRTTTTPDDAYLKPFAIHRT